MNLGDTNSSGRQCRIVKDAFERPREAEFEDLLSNGGEEIASDRGGSVQSKTGILKSWSVRTHRVNFWCKGVNKAGGIEGKLVSDRTRHSTRSTRNNCKPLVGTGPRTTNTPFETA